MLRYIAILLIFTLLLASCQSDDPSTYSSRLRVSLTDFTDFSARVGAREIFIDIRRIEIAVTEPAPREIGARATEEWIVLDFSGGEFEVMELNNGRTQQILDQWTPANRTIIAVKVVFGNNSRVVGVDHRHTPIHIPDEFREGAVFEMVTPLYTNTVTSIIIELNTFFSETDGRLYLNPIWLRAFPEATTTTLRGVVLPSEILTIVSVSNKEGKELFVVPEFVWEGRNNGRFEILGVSAGDWTVHIKPLDPQSPFSDITFVHNIEFDARRRVSEIGTIRLEVTPEDPEEPEESEEEEPEEEDEETP